MSKPPDKQLPAHLRPLTLDIPATWTPEEALAVFEPIDELRDKICALYNSQLQALLQQQRSNSQVDESDDAGDDHLEPCEF
jgi:hypothetical protein